MPNDLGKLGATLWGRMIRLADFTDAGFTLLEDICRETELIGRLESELANADPMVPGPGRQLVANPLFCEIRQHRLTRLQLFKSLNLRLSGEGMDAADNVSEKAQKAARARWERPSGLAVARSS